VWSRTYGYGLCANTGPSIPVHGSHRFPRAVRLSQTGDDLARPSIFAHNISVQQTRSSSSSSSSPQRQRTNILYTMHVICVRVLAILYYRLQYIGVSSSFVRVYYYYYTNKSLFFHEHTHTHTHNAYCI